MQAVGEAADGSDAFAMVEVYRPDVVPMDISMSVLEGVEATRIISSRFSDTKVVVLTIHNDQIYFDAALQAGACRFLSKYYGREDLFKAIKQCSPGPAKVVGNRPH